ncbi:hypothetical protein TcCL_NonESM12405 [Trypanosoma cruzi]|nr:hypothetical protein TcCL_NonESM12405 [Trypanosoma cruzi]
MRHVATSAPKVTSRTAIPPPLKANVTAGTAPQHAEVTEQQHTASQHHHHHHGCRHTNKAKKFMSAAWTKSHARKLASPQRIGIPARPASSKCIMASASSGRSIGSIPKRNYTGANKSAPTALHEIACTPGGTTPGGNVQPHRSYSLSRAVA